MAEVIRVATAEVIAEEGAIAAEMALSARRGGKSYKKKGKGKREIGRAEAISRTLSYSPFGLFPFPLLFPRCRGELQFQAFATAHDFHSIFLTGLHFA